MSNDCINAASEARLRTIIDVSPDAVMVLSGASIILFANPAAEQLFGRSATKMVGTEFGFPVTGKGTTEIEVLSESGVLQTAEMRLVDIDWEGELAVLLTLRDVTERKAAEEETRLHLKRQKAVLQLYQQMSRSSIDDIVKLVTGQCISLTESKIGFVGLVDSNQTLITEDLWSGRAGEKCVVNKPFSFPLDKAELWAEIVGQGVPITVNDCPLPNPFERELPEGQVHLSRFTGVPVLDNDEVVAVACVGNKNAAYTESDTLHLALLLERFWDLVKRKRAEASLRASEVSYRRLFEAAKDGILIVDSETGIILDANPFMIELLGYSKEVFLGRRLWELGFLGDETSNKALFAELQEKGYVRYDDMPLKTADGHKIDVEFVSNIYKSNGHTVIQCNIRDITERKRLEQQQQLAHKILTLLNRSEIAEDDIHKILTEIKKATSVDAVAIRLPQGDDFPYFATDGFSEDFLLKERFLCSRTEAGEIQRDEGGNPLLEGMCGKILRGQINPKEPFFTDWGSFWSNNNTRLLATTTEVGCLRSTRNSCIRAGYESVALVPLRAGEKTIGLLQLNDLRPDRFTPEMIYFLERVSASIGETMARRRIQLQLIEEKDFIRKALDSLLDVFYVFDLEGNLLRWNKTLNAVTGYDNREIDSMKILQFVHENDSERVAGSIQTALQKGSASLEALLLTKDGTQIPYEFNGVRLSDLQGKPIGISGLGRNITQRKQTENALHERIKELRCINSISRMANRSKISLEEFLRRAVRILPSGWLYPEHYAARITLDSTEFKTANFRETEWRQTARIEVGRKTIGTITICYLAEKPTADKGPFLKEERNLLDTIADLLGSIIQQLRAEAEIVASEEKFRVIFDSTNDGILLVDPKTRAFHFANAAIYRMLGYAQEEIENLGVMDIHREEDLPYVIEQFEKHLRREISVTATLPVKRKDGSVFFADVHSSPVEISGKHYLLSVFNDLTERRRLEAQLLHSQKMEAVGLLAGGIAHDFNNMLNVIMGYGDMVMESLAASSPAREDMCEVLVAADRAADLTQRLLVFSRKESVTMASVNINALILNLQKMLTRIIRENVEFHLDLTDTPLIVSADARQIEQVLTNLVSNAMDVMLEGGQLLITTGPEVIDEEFVSSYGYGQPGKYALITVSDTGHGMGEETLQKIFEPFFTTKKLGEGTGLGLAISYGIIQEHNGYFKAYSELGKGTTFKIFLPLVDEPVLDKEPDDTHPVKGGHETILVAEDDDALRKLSRVMLESFGYTVITAEDGEEAIAKFVENRERIDLVLLDMIMPKKNGGEVRDAIVKFCPNMKILFASGYVMEIITKRELQEDHVDFIQKPYHSKSLLLKVREILDR